MRRLAFSVLVLLLAIGGFLYQVRLAEALPSSRAVLPLAVGILLFALLSFVFSHGRLRILLAKPWLYYALAMALLMALMFFGRRYRGGIYLPGRINPSEFVKLFFVLFVAGHLAQSPSEDGRIPLRAIAVQLAAFGGLALAVVAVRDFGLLAQLGITWAAILFVASVGWGLLVALGGGLAALTILAHPFGHLAVRVAVWRDPFSDATGAGWQTLQGLAALVSGGWWGKGMGMGEVHSVPIVSSDFVYAALSEELGFAGCAIILILWSILLIMPLISNHGDSPRKNVSDATGAGWQTLQGLAALVSGGWWGKGMGMGEVHSVPIVSSDFVYAALSEELGFAGCSIILILWSILLIMPLITNHGDSPRANGDSPRKNGKVVAKHGRAVAPRPPRTARGAVPTECREGFATTLGDSPRKKACKNGDSPRGYGDSPREEMGKWLVMVGLVASLGCQLLLNVAGVLNVLPMTGITFPLLSQGGSSLVAVLAMCGILNAADSS